MKIITDEYYANNAKKLRDMVDRVLRNLRFVDVDKDDFYSLANEVFVQVLMSYDNSQDFDGFLYSCLDKKFKTEMTRRCRYKRQADKNSISIDTPIGDDTTLTLGDMIASNIDIEKEILGDNSDIIMDEKIERYLNSLTRIQRKIIEMKMEDVEVQSIKEKLGLTDSQYNSHMKEAVQYEHIRLLHI